MLWALRQVLVQRSTIIRPAEFSPVLNYAGAFHQLVTGDPDGSSASLPEHVGVTKVSEDPAAWVAAAESEEVEDLLRYDDDTAGGIMVPDFIALKEDVTAREAIESLQKEHSDVEMAFYLYVVDEYGKLVGVSSLRQLVVVPPECSFHSHTFSMNLSRP